MTTQVNTTQKTTSLFGKVSGRHRLAAGALPSNTPLPLIVAIHGGSYTSAYFDVPGCSLMDLAGDVGVPIIAPDRLGYGESPMPLPTEATVKGQARYLVRALKDAWQRYGGEAQGIFIIGHSIGGAMTLAMASEPEDLPLLGIAVSGVGLHTPAEHKPLWEQLPDTPTVDMPQPVKEQLMFGPLGSYDPQMPKASSAVANAPAPKAELVDIVSTWNQNAPEILGKITVPVHYRQGEFDHLWIVDQNEVDGFRKALSSSSRVDAALMRGTGHCMDYHHVGRSLQLQQLGFALQCASEKAFK